jgi:hypothetical protein
MVLFYCCLKKSSRDQAQRRQAAVELAALQLLGAPAVRPAAGIDHTELPPPLYAQHSDSLGIAYHNEMQAVDPPKYEALPLTELLLDRIDPPTAPATPIVPTVECALPADLDPPPYSGGNRTSEL